MPVPLQRNVLPALVAFAAAFALGQSDLAERFENLTLDWRTRLRAQLQPTSPSQSLVIVGIDERSLRTFGRWPWPYARHGDFIQLVGQLDPGAVSWDVLFTEAAPDTKDFAAGIVASECPVVLGAVGAKPGMGLAADDPAVRATRLMPLPKIQGDRSRILSAPEMLVPTAQLATAADAAFVDTPPGTDGVRRSAPLLVRIGDAVYPTLALRTLIAYWHAVPQQIDVRLGDAITIETPQKRWRIPIDATGAYAINYRHGLDGYSTFGYSLTFQALRRAYVDHQPGWIPPLHKRIVLIGEVADGLSDFGPTPFSPLTPLVLVHANIIENVLDEDFIRVVPAWRVWLTALFVGFVGLAVFSERRLREQIAFSLGLPIIYLLGATVAWVDQSWAFPLVAPLVGFGALQVFMISRRVLSEQRAKEQIKGMFGTYVSPSVVERMIGTGQMPRLGGHEEEITAYFSDIQGYSTFSEKLTPDRLVELLNEYLTVCTDIVQAEGGTLDKYIGDAVVAMFGAPVALPDHAYRACVAALQVQLQLGVLRERWDREGARWPEGVRKMQSRIGLNTGRATIGNMGSRTRFNYTMTGDNVNLAARMESAAKTWGVYTMCTEATKLACEFHRGDRVLFRPLGRIVVMGRSQPVQIFELVGLKETTAATAYDCVALFSDGLKKFLERDWAGAMAAFKRSRELEPNRPGQTPGVKTNPSLIYLRMAEDHAAQPPPASWDGVYIMSEK
jgi:adenylate cyclase